MPIPPKPGDAPRIIIDDVIGAPAPISEEEAEHARSTPDPAFFDEDPDA